MPSRWIPRRRPAAATSPSSSHLLPPYLLLVLFLSSLDCALANGCYFYDIDFLGEDINYGLNNLKDSAEACQASCVQADDCNYWTWASPRFEAVDPAYVYSCWHKSALGQQVEKEGAVSGPRTCPPRAGCCSELMLDSSGGAADVQDARLGKYDLYYVDDDGRNVYVNVEEDKPFGDQYMYYMPDLSLWYVGESIGVNYAGLNNRNTGECPENFDTVWEYFTWSGVWAEDPTLKASCRGQNQERTTVEP